MSLSMRLLHVGEKKKSSEVMIRKVHKKEAELLSFVQYSPSLHKIEWYLGMINLCGSHSATLLPVEPIFIVKY